ncbi:TPA: conjugal transfer protein TraM [Legionella pneumophila]|nr:conjugal transfer protein TraM [Legionella pneumophila]HBD9283358.1 conjugal transfer protein TraM [Legionella pneumophila]
MPHKINEAIQDIAIKHGVVLGKDDPILILQTMNDRLLEENRKAQQEMLAQFKEEMENISSQWKDDAKEKAEKILNTALASSKEAMAKLSREAISESILTTREMISNSLAEARALKLQTRKYSILTLLTSAIMLTAFCMFMLFFLGHDF